MDTDLIKAVLSVDPLFQPVSSDFKPNEKSSQYLTIGYNLDTVETETSRKVLELRNGIPLIHNESEWSKEDEEELKNRVERIGKIEEKVEWEEVSQHFPGRSWTDCKDRFSNKLDTSLKWIWNEEDERELLGHVNSSQVSVSNSDILKNFTFFPFCLLVPRLDSNCFFDEQSSDRMSKKISETINLF